MRLGRVFVSSVFGGMLDLRKVAADAAALLGLAPVLTEEHVAQPGTVRDALAREIAACDTYVGLFAHRRGTVPPAGTPDHRAITEEEFRFARELGLRCLVFLSKDGDREPGLAEFLESEVSDYATGVWARSYGTPESLRREIVAAVAAVRPRVVLALGSGPEGLQARLSLKDLQPAWTGEASLGPVPVDLNLGAGTRGVFEAFHRGPTSRNHLRNQDLQAAGGDLADRALPGPLGDALAQALDLAAGTLVTVEIRTEEDSVLPFPWELLSLPRHPLPVKEGKIEIVRRLTLPGDAADPAQDPAPSVPPEHLAILGFTAAPAEDLAEQARLGAGGISDSDLFWEKEQESLLAALDGLLREGRGRLILPDTGTKEELRRELARPDRPHVVHISCHGGVVPGPDGAPEPALFLEDSDGHRAPLTGPELLSWLRATPGAEPPGLLVLSACSTAGGLAESLVRGGLPRVLGMQSTVTDTGATAFAEGLYAALARGTDLAVALRAGRAGLSAHGGPHEWAIPTLTLRRDAGPLAAPEGTAPPVATPFEAAREQLRIAGISYLDQGYVGRRDAERRLRRAFDRGERMIVIHGLGGIGKSTLAARFLERRRGEGARVLVLYAGRALAPATLLDEIASKIGVARTADLPPTESEARFREDLGNALRKVTPTLLLLDNFEDNQDPDGHLLNPDLGTALLDLARLGGPALRLLITSRLSVELPPGPIEAVNLDLGELSPSGCRKLRLLDPDGLGRLDDSTWRQVTLRLGGHPKALELLGGYLRGKPDRARSLMKKLDEAIHIVDGKLSAKDQERGRSLLVETVLDNVPAARLPAFDRLCLLNLPFPTEELEELLTAAGVSDPVSDISWLRDHGLLARAVAPSALTGGDLVHRLLADRRRGALAEREGEDAARAWHLRVAGYLVERPGALSDLGAAARHLDAAGDRAGALELYNRWALKLRDRYAYAACIQVAQEGLEALPIRNNEAERVAAAGLWRRIHDGLTSLGKLAEASAALEASLRLAETTEGLQARFSEGSARLRKGKLLAREGRRQEAEEELGKALSSFAAAGSERDRAVTMLEVAWLREQSGDVSGALKLLEESLGIFESLEDEQARATTLTDLARLHESSNAAKALKLYEEALRIFESLRDVRARALTLGAMARLRAESGDASGALQVQLERLEVERQLGDVDGIAAAQFDLANLDLKEKRFAEARARLAESWEINLSLGRVDGIAIVGELYGRLLLASDRDQAVMVLRTAREAAHRLGWPPEIGRLDALLEKLENPDES